MFFHAAPSSFKSSISFILSHFSSARLVWIVVFVCLSLFRGLTVVFNHCIRLHVPSFLANSPIEEVAHKVLKEEQFQVSVSGRRSLFPPNSF